MTNTAHTPTPWRAVYDSAELVKGIRLGDQGTEFRLYNGDAEGVAYVLRALNAHDELVAALREIAEGNPRELTKAETHAELTSAWGVHARAIARAALAKWEA